MVFRRMSICLLETREKVTKTSTITFDLKILYSSNQNEQELGLPWWSSG